MKARSKGMTIAVWVVSALLATLYVETGTKKVLPDVRGTQETTVLHFRAWGYSDGFRVFIGSAELAGAAGLLLPPLTTIATVAFVPIMLGATHNHIKHKEGAGAAMVPMVAMSLLFFVGYQRRSDLLRFPGCAAHVPDSDDAARVG